MRASTLLTTEEAAKYLNVKPRFIRHLRQQGVLCPVKVGRLVRYESSHLDAFIERSRTEGMGN